MIINGDHDPVSRECLIAEIETALDGELADAAERMPASARKAIKDEIVGYTKRILDSLTSKELQSESAYQRFLQTTLAQVRMRIWER
jgi:hypothetical protein